MVSINDKRVTQARTVFKFNVSNVSPVFIEAIHVAEKGRGLRLLVPYHGREYVSAKLPLGGIQFASFNALQPYPP